MAAKDKYTEEMLKYLCNPDNEFPTRVSLATDVLKLATSQQLYKIFTVDELSEIEAKSLEVRRSKYAPELAKVDRSMLREAAGGDSKAAKLCYERFEGWRAKKDITITPGKDEDGNALKWEVEIVRPVDKKE